MKILNIILDARIAGPQIRIAEVGKHLKDKDIETITLFPKNLSMGFSKLMTNYKLNYKTLCLHRISRTPLMFFKWFLLFIPETIKLRRIIKKEKPDIVHCTGSWQWKGIIAAKLSGTTVIWHLNDTFMPSFILFVFKQLVKYTDGFIVEGSKVKRYYIKSFSIKKPIFEIQSPVDTNRFNPHLSIKPDKRIISSKGVRIITVGNINKLKGLEYFIDAAFILNKKFSNLSFFIVGEEFSTQKKYADKLKEKIKDYKLKNLFFYGSTSNIPSILKATDIFICPSIFEASPQSVWEAMAMEKAIVSTDVGSVPDFINDGENGYIVPTHNPEKLAEKIDTLICSKELRNQFGRKARKTAQRELDVEIASRKHKECYDLILEKTKKIK